MKHLSDLRPGEKAIIHKIEENSALRRRLMEMGIREGKEVLMRRNAPMGDPMEISIMGYNLSLRRSEAKWVAIDHVETLAEEGL